MTFQVIDPEARPSDRMFPSCVERIAPVLGDRGTEHPNERWMMQVARNVTMEEWGFLQNCRYLIHDRDSKYTRAFRAIIQSGRVRLLRLAHADPAMLVARFGLHYGTWLTDAAHGRDERPVVMRREPKSISCETTFEHDLHPMRDRAALSNMLLGLCQSVSGNLGRKSYLGKTIGIKLRYDDFRTVTRDVTLEEATADPETIRAAARTCLQRVALDRKLRLLGIRITSLRPSRYVGDLSTAAVCPDGNHDRSHAAADSG